MSLDVGKVIDVAHVVAAGLEAIGEIVAAIRGAQTGEVKPEVALERIAGARSRLAARRAEADAALDARFPDEPEGGR